MLVARLKDSGAVADDEDVRAVDVASEEELSKDVVLDKDAEEVLRFEISLVVTTDDDEERDKDGMLPVERPVPGGVVSLRPYNTPAEVEEQNASKADSKS